MSSAWQPMALKETPKEPWFLSPNLPHFHVQVGAFHTGPGPVTDPSPAAATHCLRPAQPGAHQSSQGCTLQAVPCPPARGPSRPATPPPTDTASLPWQPLRVLLSLGSTGQVFRANPPKPVRGTGEHRVQCPHLLFTVTWLTLSDALSASQNSPLHHKGVKPPNLIQIP